MDDAERLAQYAAQIPMFIKIGGGGYSARRPEGVGDDDAAAARELVEGSGDEVYRVALIPLTETAKRAMAAAEKQGLVSKRTGVPAFAMMRK